MPTLAAIAEAVGVRLVGAGEVDITGVAPLGRAQPGQISFCAHPSYRPLLASTRASAVVIAPDALGDCAAAALVSDNPQLTFARIAALFSAAATPYCGVHPTAWVAATAVVAATATVGPFAVVEAEARVEEGAIIGPHCVVGQGALVGANTHLVASVVLCHGVVIGAGCLLHPGAVVGSDGFGLAWDGDAKGWVKIPQLGGVRVGNGVEIGANTTIDRGALDDTVIEDGVKLDNLIQIAHNVRVGSATAIAACVGVSGSVVIGQRCRIGGGVGIAGHLTIGDDVVLTGMTLVTKSLPRRGVYSSGVPATGNKLWNRLLAHLRRLDALTRRVTSLERQLQAAASPGSRDCAESEKGDNK